MATQSFSDRCYSALKRVPKGRVTTYKEIARALGTKAYRAVGNAMATNPNAPKVPCHRVVTTDGRVGGYAFGIKKKIQILHKEGVFFEKGRVKDFKRVMFKLR